MSDAIRNAFIGRKEAPTDGDLHTVLGPAARLWDQLIASLAADYDVAIQEWSSYSLKAGWSMRLKRGKRTIVWLQPGTGCFEAAFILGAKAIASARQRGLSARGAEALERGQKFSEGTAVRLLVKGPRDLPAVKKLAVVKLEN